MHIIYERKGRRYARRLGLSLTGTLGVLWLTKEDELITAVTPFLQQLLDSSLYFFPELVDRTLALATSNFIDGPDNDSLSSSAQAA